MDKFLFKKNYLLLVLRPRCKIKELFALIHQSFEKILHESDERVNALSGPIGYHRVRTDFPNLVYIGIFLNSRGKASLFPPKKNKQNGKALGPLKHLDPRQGATPKDVDGTSEVQQCIDIPWKETNEEGARYSHYSRQSTKDP